MRDALSLSPARAALLVVLFSLIGGFAALFALLACQYIVSFHGAADAADKHGISTQKSVRLGGIFIATFWLAELLIQTEIAGHGLNLDFARVSLAYCAGLFALGLYSDLKADVSAAVRLVIMFALACVALLLRPALVLEPVGVSWIDPWLLQPGRVAILFTAAVLTVLPNAFNTADGANGLVSGVSFFTLLALSPFMNMPEWVLSTIELSLILFLLLNLMTGRFFLGDSGAYLCGAMVGFAVIYVSNTYVISVWYLVTLIFYPLFDLVFAMVRRLLEGRSPMAPDDEHLHNLLFYRVRPAVRSPRLANTVTGVSIATLFTASPWYLFNSGFVEEGWGIVIATQSLTYLTLWWLCRRRQEAGALEDRL